MSLYLDYRFRLKINSDSQIQNNENKVGRLFLASAILQCSRTANTHILLAKRHYKAFLS